MSDNKITKVIKYLDNRPENQRAVELSKYLKQNIPEGQKEYAIQKHIHPNILKQILKGEIK